jgi:hypothetical protein
VPYAMTTGRSAPTTTFSYENSALSISITCTGPTPIRPLRQPRDTPCLCARASVRVWVGGREGIRTARMEERERVRASSAGPPRQAIFRAVCDSGA